MIREFLHVLSAVTLVMGASGSVAQLFAQREVTLIVNYGAGEPMTGLIDGIVF